MKPLFIPLRSCYFDAFADGSKTVEWRPYGPRWNDKTVWPGRPVTLSRGYSGARLRGCVISMDRVPRHVAPKGVCALYPTAEYFCAIHVSVHRPTHP